MTRATPWLVVAALVLPHCLLSEGAAPQTAAAILDVRQTYTSLAYIGDGKEQGKYLQVDLASAEKPHSAKSCIKIRYTPGPEGWAGVYWLNLPNNLGDSPGDDLSQRNFTELSFWARGETGKEVVEFKAGCINGEPFKDSFSISFGKIALTQEWKRYSISLTGQNLKSVIGVFRFALGVRSNPQGATFYLDEISYK